MNQHLNELIPKAIQAIEEKIAREDGTVIKEYKGYLNSMGPGIIQAGLVTMLAFCTDLTVRRTDTARFNVLRAIHHMLDRDEAGGADNHLLKYVITRCQGGNQPYHSDQRVTSTDLDPEKVEEMENTIMTHVIALKLAIKTFHLIEKPKEDEP